MALTENDIQILKAAKQQGKTKEQALAMLAQNRAGGTTEPQAKPGLFSRDGLLGKAADKITDTFGLRGVADTYGATFAKARTNDPQQRQIISQDQPTKRETIASALKGGATFVPGAGAGAGIARAAGFGAAGGLLYDIGQNVEEGAEGAEVFSPGAGTFIGSVAGPGAGPAVAGGRKFAKVGADQFGRALSKGGDFITQSPTVKGAIQTGVELGERVPRFLSKRKADIRDAATRADRIASSPAPVGKAITSGVDERIINTIEQSDDATRKGYAEIVRLAEESIDTSGTIKMKSRPEIVAGEAAASQYKLVNEKKREIGAQIGEQVKALSTDVSVPMRDAYSELDDALTQMRIRPVIGANGVKLDFSKTGFSKAQRTKIQELYDLATEGGDTLTPSEIHAKDRLFSQLQREARFEGIGDVIMDTADGQVSLFRVFRDVYSDTLEGVTPEIRQLNRQYRNLSTFTDDIENTIIKSGKYETNSKVDPAEFAQTNLRRLFSEAQSAADYRAIADEMDVAARALGYDGAKPEDLAQFAYEIRKIYPESTPRTGFEGSIRSVGDAVTSVLGAGKADLSDQQKALRELIEFYQSAQ